MQIEMNEDHISLKIREDKSIIPWSDVKKAVITDEMVLLYPRDTVFFIFPKENFSGDEYATFIELVKSKVEKVF